jgi:hypothetical protein
MSRPMNDILLPCDISTPCAFCSWGMNYCGKKIAISRAADSGESDP